MTKCRRLIAVICLVISILLATGAVAFATSETDTDTTTDTAADETATGADDSDTDSLGSLNNIVDTVFGENTETIDIIILLTILTLAPSILMMLTAFTRIIIVLSILRNAMSMQQTPPAQIMIGLALFLTFFVMQPVITEVYDTAYVPYTQGEISQDELIDTAMLPIRDFMYRQIFTTDLDFFTEMSGNQGDTLEELPNSVLIPAFITSEIKRAFQIGFFLYIPFIVVDMVVASTLMSMGMMMLPPAMISLPFKILLFVMVDGWQLVIKTLLDGFG